jgi:hypothetical protein
MKKRPSETDGIEFKTRMVAGSSNAWPERNVVSYDQMPPVARRHYF